MPPSTDSSRRTVVLLVQMEREELRLAAKAARRGRLPDSARHDKRAEALANSVRLWSDQKWGP